MESISRFPSFCVNWMLQIWHKTSLSCQKRIFIKIRHSFVEKCTFHKIQDGGCRHLEFRKTFAISLLLNRSAPNLVGMLQIWHRTSLSCQKRIFIKIQDIGCRHLELRKIWLFLYFYANPHQIWWECCKFNIEHNCHVENAHSLKFKMAAATILNLKKLLPFLYILVNSHQTWWGYSKFDVECTCWVWNEHRDQNSRWQRHSKTVVISWLLNRSAPNLVGM